MHTYFCHGWGMGMMGGWTWLIILVILFVLIWLIIKGPVHSNSAPEKDDSALKILRERYARGEIGKEEFDAKKKDLQ